MFFFFSSTYELFSCFFVLHFKMGCFFMYIASSRWCCIFTGRIFSSSERVFFAPLQGGLLHFWACLTLLLCNCYFHVKPLTINVKGGERVNCVFTELQISVCKCNIYFQKLKVDIIGKAGICWHVCVAIDFTY